MNVLVIMNSTDVKLGGGIIQVILNYKKELEDEDINMTYAINCIKNSKIPDMLNSKKSSFIDLPNKKKNFLKYCIKLYKIMHSNKFDVVHVHGNSANMLIELGIAKLNGIPCRIAHSHNSTCKNPKLNRLLIPIFKKTYTKALACSEMAGEWLFGKNNFTVMNNAIDLNSFKFSKEIRYKYRKKLNVDENTKIIGHVGNINTQKNHEFLIRLFKLYNDENSNSLLILIGDGPLKQKVIDLVKKLQLQEKVIFLGIKNDVNNWMQAMDILVFPSLWEGFGMVLIEAQAAGLPVLASNVVPSIIKINDNVSFLDLNENTNEDWNKEILNLLNATRSRTIREDDFCDYDINKQGKKILEFYEE
jgi:glycosyltransferase involved in cell wall biosynthesis